MKPSAIIHITYSCSVVTFQMYRMSSLFFIKTVSKPSGQPSYIFLNRCSSYTGYGRSVVQSPRNQYIGGLYVENLVGPAENLVAFVVV